MIRINLSGLPKPRKGGKRAQVVVTPSGEGPSFILFALVALLIAGAGLGFWWNILKIGRAHV